MVAHFFVIINIQSALATSRRPVPK